MNKVAKLAVSSIAVAGLAFGAIGCEASSDFKKECKDAGGVVERDHETLGMSAVAFVEKGGRGGGSGKSSGKSRSGGGSKKSKSSGKVSGNGSSKSKKSKSSQTDDNEWVCMKDGVEIMEES